MKAFLLLALFACASAAAMPPNIIIIFTDDQGYGDLSCFGHPSIKTPHVDQLAREGRKFTHFHVPAPVCTPSRAALLTACYPKRVGLHRHVIFPGSNYGLHPDEVTIAEVLNDHGYTTACIGKWHLGHREGLLPNDQGFDQFFGVPYSNDMSQFHREEGNNYKHSLPLMRNNKIIEWEPDQRLLTRRYTESAVSFITESAKAKAPFFLYLPHTMPHLPLYASDPFRGKSAHGIYGDVIEELDWSVGELRNAVDRAGIAENTIIIFTSDNGPRVGFAGPLRGKKGTIFEGGQRVPMIVWAPGRASAGTTCALPVTSMDLMPSLLRLAGAAMPRDRETDGHDVSALLLGLPGASSETPVFFHYSKNGELAGIRRGPWKLHLKSGELFNLDDDIRESINLATAYRDLVASLHAEALAFDAQLTSEMRPAQIVAEPLWDPAHRVRPAP